MVFCGNFWKKFRLRNKMASTKPKEERVALIKENLAEVLNFEIVEKILDENTRLPKVYWGMSSEFGYFRH